MKKLLPLALLLSSASLYANDVRGILNGALKVSSPTEEFFCEDNGYEEELYHQCAVDLCGSPETAPTAMVNDKNFEKFADKAAMQKFPELDEPIKKIFDNKKAELLSLVDNLDKKLKDKRSLDLDKWKPHEVETLAGDLFEDYVEVSFDYERPLKERVSINVYYPENAPRAVKKGLDDYAEILKDRFYKDPVYALSGEFYTYEESVQLLRNLSKTFFDDYNKHLQNKPDLLQLSREEMEKFKDIDSLKLNSSYEVTINYTTLLNLYRKLHLETKRPLPDEDVRLCEKDCKNGLKEFLKTYDLKKKSAQFRKILNELNVSDAIQNCQAEMIQKTMGAGDKEEFKKNFPEIKNRFLTDVMKNYSDHSRKAWSDYLENNIHLSFENEDAEDLDSFLNEIKTHAAAAPDNYNDSSTPSLVSSLLSYRTYADPNKFDVKIGYCFSNTVFAAWDAFQPSKHIEEAYLDVDPTKDNIFVSKYSCTHANEGKGIVAHEMGHALSYAFVEKKLSKHSEDVYNQIRNCTTGLYSSPLPLPGEAEFLNRKGDSLRTEEDTADVIAFMATNHDKKLFTCSLFDTNKEGTRYKKLSLVNTHNDDTHSSPLLRAIRESLYKKKTLSPACQAIMKNNQDKFRFTPCI